MVMAMPVSVLWVPVKHRVTISTPNRFSPSTSLQYRAWMVRSEI